MVTDPIVHRPDSAHDTVRSTLAVLIIVCLSTAPFVSINRWLTEDPLALETWPYVFSFWGAALLGVGLFVLDVIAPIVRAPLARSRQLFLAMAPLGALGMWAMASAIWTASPARTPQQALLMASVSLGAVWFGYALTFRQHVVALFIALHGLTLVSVPLAVGLTSARLPDDGSWMGLFANPNTLGPIAALGIVVAIGAMLLTEVPWLRLVIVACSVIDFVVAVEADSLTGWLALGGAFTAIGLLVLGRVLAARGANLVLIRVAGLAIVFVALGVLKSMLTLVADLFGKDASLTGRRHIWEFVLDSMDDRWMVGFGWYSFWDDPAHVAELYARSYQTIDSAHSTFMETLLFLGAIGLVLLLVVVVVGFGRTWWVALQGTSLAMMWWAAVATFCLLENVTESMIAYNSIFWWLLVACGFAAARTDGDDVSTETH